jgi:hypothetical protein
MKKYNAAFVFGLLALGLMLFDGFAGMQVFNNLASISAHYKQTFSTMYDEPLAELQQHNETPSPPPPSPIITLPNGTHLLYFYGSMTLNFNIATSGVIINNAEYAREVVFWTSVENIFETARDIYEAMIMISAALLVVFSLLGFKFLRPLPKVM